MTEAANIAAVARGREEIAVQAARPDDRMAKAVAMFVFALGVGMLLAVFFWTKDWFESLARANQQWLKLPATPGQEPALTDYIPAFGAQALRAGLLFVLGYLASSVATKGAQLFAATGPSKSNPDAP